MKNWKRIWVFLAAGIILFAACQSKKEKLTVQIAEAEKQLAESYHAEVVNHLVALYQEYATKYAEDSLAAEYLFRAADGNMRLQKGEAALANLDMIINNYPNHRRVPESYFVKGLVYEDVLFDVEAAKTAYYEFVALFPSHELALTASIAISYLGKSPEEIVASFHEDATQISEE